MSVEKMREEFEAEYAKDFKAARGLPMTAEDVARMREGDHYGVSRGYLNGCWWGWQASRAALVIELPPKGIDSINEGESAAWHNVRNSTIAACKRAIEAAGVKCK